MPDNTQFLVLIFTLSRCYRIYQPLPDYYPRLLCLHFCLILSIFCLIFMMMNWLQWRLQAILLLTQFMRTKLLILCSPFFHCQTSDFPFRMPDSRTLNLFNQFQPNIVFHIETSHLIYFANQMSCFCMKCNTWLKWIKTIVSSIYKQFNSFAVKIIGLVSIWCTLVLCDINR